MTPNEQTTEEKVAALEQKDRTDESKCDARHQSDHTRLNLLENALWGVNRDGEGGVVNKLNLMIIKTAIYTGVASSVGSAVLAVTIQYLTNRPRH